MTEVLFMSEKRAVCLNVKQVQYVVRQASAVTDHYVSLLDLIILWVYVTA